MGKHYKHDIEKPKKSRAFQRGAHYQSRPKRLRVDPKPESKPKRLRASDEARNEHQPEKCQKKRRQLPFRDLFPEAIRLISEINPRAVMLENVRGLLDPKFDTYRNSILSQIEALGYRVQIKLLNASDYGVPQLRPRVIIVGIRNDIPAQFTYPTPTPDKTPTVGETIGDLMQANGWHGADAWIAQANTIAPTVVGGSKKHGGPDLGPVRARKAWSELGVDGLGVANDAPAADFDGMPRLTPRMIARIQGFPDNWSFGDRKTAACRMIGNAFPPPVAKAVGEQIREVLTCTSQS